MPYRVRIFTDEHAIRTTDHQTPLAAGRRVAEFPLDYLGSDPGHTRTRREIVYVDEGGERPVTSEENQIVFEAMNRRMAEVVGASKTPCPRCGRRAVEHEGPLSPALFNTEGPIYFSCWTAVERADEALLDAKRWD